MIEGELNPIEDIKEPNNSEKGCNRWKSALPIVFSLSIFLAACTPELPIVPQMSETPTSTAIPTRISTGKLSATSTSKPTEIISQSAISQKRKLEAVKTAQALIEIRDLPISAEDLLNIKTPTPTLTPTPTPTATPTS